MMSPHRRSSALDHYRQMDLKSRIETASPHVLVTMLYDHLDAALNAASTAYAQGRSAAFTRQMGRARSLLAALEAGLDMQQGGALAELLQLAYRSMQRRLSDVADHPAAIDEVRAGLGDMARSWNALKNPNEQRP
jgi:flagellar secretion chaperone FliS